MARSHARGRRERLQKKWDEKLTGPKDDIEDESLDVSDQRPDKEWLRKNRRAEED